MDETEQGYGIEYVVLADGFRVLKRCSGDRRQNVDRDRIRTDLAEFKREFGSLSDSLSHADDSAGANFETDFAGGIYGVDLVFDGVGGAER